MQSMRGCSPPFVRPATSYESTPSRVPEIASPPAVPSGASIPRMAALTTFQPRSRSPPAAQAPLLPRPSALTQSIYSTPMPSHQQPVEFETTPSAVPRGFQGPNSKAAGLFPTPSSAPHHGHLHVQEGMLPFNSKATMQALPQPPSPTAMSWRVGKHGSQEGAERGLDMFSTNNWSSKPDRVSPVAFPQSMHGGLPHVPEGLHAHQPAASWNDHGFEELMSAFRAPNAFSMQKFQQEQPKQHQSQPKQPMQPMHPLPLEGYSQVAPVPLSYTMPAPQVLPAVTSTIHLQAGRVEQNEAPAPQLPPMTTEGVCTDWCVYLADVPADAPLSSIWKVFVELGLTPCGVAVTVVQQPQHSSLFSSKPVGPASSRFGRVYFTSSHAAAGARSHTKLWIRK
ncbi:hypothetical protein CAOG_009609 [Capsaspora owczarzaki ATCC 30864]|uniref:Uncharacterized protein n=1 Tax=Capsaspora owczarzaki (strain ATCC 30864) TaxID=595528 RepID=A0A0D2UA38_CAPO3|nr:hypothetical protein CAOG_009609 [Capsaspora owczarzaki ATCC 30864]